MLDIACGVLEQRSDVATFLERSFLGLMDGLTRYYLNADEPIEEKIGAVRGLSKVHHWIMTRVALPPLSYLTLRW